MLEFESVKISKFEEAFTSEDLNDVKNVLLRIESTNNCNFACTFCPHPQMVRTKGYMSEELFYDIINQASELGMTKLDLRNFGEPILDKRLPQLAKYASDRGFDKIYIHTNGYGISKKLVDAWGSSGIKDVNISLSPKREFSVSRPGVNVDRLFAQIESLMQSDCEWKDILSIDYIKTGMSSAEEENEFLQWVEKNNLKKRIDIELHNWAMGTTSSFMQCHRLWTSITVLWDGKVPLCCLDYEGEVQIGDLTSHKLSEIINNETYKLIRKNHLNGLFLKKCASCNMVEVKDMGAKPVYTKIG